IRAHLRRRDVAWIDRRITGREHRDQRRLRPLKMQRDLEITVGGDLDNVVEQVLARILAELVLGLALQKVERAFHVLRRERLAVMPPDALMQPERQRKVVATHAPAVRQVGNDRAHRILRLVLIVYDKVVVEAHRGGVYREGRLLMDRERGRRLAMIDSQDSAMLGVAGFGKNKRWRSEGDEGQSTELGGTQKT